MSSNLTVTGSATGNPRNKTALKPGFSLVGWIRLGSSGEDLTGLKGKIIQVSHQELAKHNKTSDCWMAIRGKVYNVTRYLDYHPGGAAELMRGAGKDATSLFDEAHAYVNIDQLLAKCFVGPLRNTVTLNLKDSSSTMDLRGKLSPPSSSLASLLKLPSVLSLSSEGLNKVEKFELPVSPQIIEIIPRFDWIQKTSELSIYYYTKSLCNPGVSIERISDKECVVNILIANTSNSYKFLFLKSLKWPCLLKINQETGKIEIVFEKILPELWSNFGIFERTRTKDETVFSDFHVVSRNFFNEDSFELVLKAKSEKVIAVPIGYHLNLRSNVSGITVTRPYTPISFKYAYDKAIPEASSLLFLIKSYKVGTLSKYLSQNSSNENVAVSLPKGNLNLTNLRPHTRFALIAAGSGITPMISVIDYLLERNTPRTELISLYFFNKTEADIWLQGKFDELKLKDERLTVKHILSDASELKESPNVSRGRITSTIVDEIVSKQSSFVFVCGPPVFNEVSIRYLQEHEVDVHCFQG